MPQVAPYDSCKSCGRVIYGSCGYCELWLHMVELSKVSFGFDIPITILVWAVLSDPLAFRAPEHLRVLETDVKTLVTKARLRVLEADVKTLVRKARSIPTSQYVGSW